MKNSTFLIIALGFVTLSLGACSATSNASGQQNGKKMAYPEAIKFFVSEVVDSDADKKMVMNLYEEFGGSKVSRERGEEACKSLEAGENMEELAVNQLHKAQADLNHSSDAEKVMALTSLYTAEVFAAQVAICPDTKVDLEF